MYGFLLMINQYNDQDGHAATFIIPFDEYCTD